MGTKKKGVNAFGEVEERTKRRDRKSNNTNQGENDQAVEKSRLGKGSRWGLEKATSLKKKKKESKETVGKTSGICAERDQINKNTEGRI